MANKDYNYETIDRPYDGNLERSEAGVVGGGESGSVVDTGDGSTSPTPESQTSTPVETTEPEVTTGQSLDNLWLENWIKSRSYRPKTHGFYINAKQGYIECMQLYVGSGGIEGGSLHIPNKTSANSWHVDAAGLMWSGASVANKGTAPVRLNPTGEMTLGDPTGVHLQLSGPNLRIQTSDFSSGALGKGWKIDTDYAEFQNIVARGKITTSAFEKNTISAVGGNVVIADADVLAADMTALDASTLTTTNVVFADDTIIRIKDGTDDEWLKVDSSVGYVHTVTRDLAAAYGADSNPVWTKGTAVVSMAEVDSGLIEMDVSATNSPFMKVKVRDSLTYNDLDTKVIIGNLKDKTGVEEYGIWIGSGAAYIAGYRLFGAVVDAAGDGDYTDIQSALDDGATKIFVRSGTYTVSSSIIITDDDVSILGEDWSDTIVVAGNSLNDNVIEIGDGTNPYGNITLKNLQIDGNTAGNTDGSCVHIRDDITNLTIEHCDIHSSENHCILFQPNSGTGATNANIINNLIHDSTDGSGIELVNAYNTYIQGNRIYNIGDDPSIDIDGISTETFVTNNFISDGTGRGITVSSGSSLVVCNTIVDNDDVGIFINTRNNIISNNFLRDNNMSSSSTDKAEIAVHSGDNSVTGNVIQINDDGYDDYGIFLDSSRINVTGNNVEQNGANNNTGIHMDESGWYCVVIGNVVDGFDTPIDQHASGGNNDVSHNHES